MMLSKPLFLKLSWLSMALKRSSQKVTEIHQIHHFCKKWKSHLCYPNYLIQGFNYDVSSENWILKGRTRLYSKESIFHLRKLWHIMDHICSKKMQAAFPIWLEFYQAPNFTKSVKKELLSMSSATIDRRRKKY